MKTLKVRNDQESGNYDLVLNLSGDFDTVTGMDMIKQNITTNIYAQKEEWFLDVNFGVPYSRIRDGKAITQTDLESIFAEAISGTDGVSHVYSISVDKVPASSRHPRDYTVNYHIETVHGELRVASWV